MKLSLKPLGDRLVVEPIEQEEVTAGGIVLPETAKDVKVGDKVLYAKYGGTEFKMDGKKLLILRESDLLAVIE
jgi:chaperonin GroES